MADAFAVANGFVSLNDSAFFLGVSSTTPIHAIEVTHTSDENVRGVGYGRIRFKPLFN